MRFMVFCVLAVGWGLHTPSANACTCSFGGSYPADGETGVPIDVELVVRTDQYGPPFLRTALGEDVQTRARRERGIGGDWYLVAPLIDLEPDSDYELVYGDTTVHFATSDDTSRAPTPADVMELSILYADFRQCETSSCTTPDDLFTTALRYRPSADAKYYQIIVSGQQQSWSRLVTPDFGGILQTSFCNDAPLVPPGEVWCAELVTVGASGARAAAGSIVCSESRGCAHECTSEDLQRCVGIEAGPIETERTSGGGCQVSEGSSARGCALIWLCAIALLRISPLVRRRCRVRDKSGPCSDSQSVARFSSDTARTPRPHDLPHRLGQTPRPRP